MNKYIVIANINIEKEFKAKNEDEAILKMENGPEFGLPKNSFIPTRTSILPLLESTNKLSIVSLYLDSNENLKLNENLHNPTGQNRIKIILTLFTN